MIEKSRSEKSKALGKMGEDLACRLLQQRGMQILARNFVADAERNQYGGTKGGHNEIDIIAFDGHSVRFVEVKTRREPLEGQPWEAVGTAKQNRIASAARDYIASDAFRQTKVRAEEYQFDVVTVIWNKEGTQCRTEYIPEAFVMIYV